MPLKLPFGSRCIMSKIAALFSSIFFVKQWKTHHARANSRLQSFPFRITVTECNLSPDFYPPTVHMTLHHAPTLAPSTSPYSIMQQLFRIQHEDTPLWINSCAFNPKILSSINSCAFNPKTPPSINSCAFEGTTLHHPSTRTPPHSELASCSVSLQ